MAPACVTWDEMLCLFNFQTHQVQGVDLQSERHRDGHKNYRWTVSSRRRDAILYIWDHRRA